MPAKSFSREVEKVIRDARIDKDQVWAQNKLARRLPPVVEAPVEAPAVAGSTIVIEDEQKLGYCGDCGRSDIPDVYEFEVDPILDQGKMVSPRRLICDECYQELVVRAEKIEDEEGISVIIKPIKKGVSGGGSKKRK